MNQPDLSVIILTRDEELHIKRSIESLLPIRARIIVVDSGSTDRTIDIAQNLGAEVIKKDWMGYARQFNWALEHCGISTKWVMRLDADEYIDNDLAQEVGELEHWPSDVCGLICRRKVIFMNQFIRWGGYYPIWLMRIFRLGSAKSEVRSMDEHLILHAGTVRKLRGHIIDHGLKPIGIWTDKHNSYASRAALDHFQEHADQAQFRKQAIRTRVIRFLKNHVYGRSPLGIRVYLYFFFRYILRLGFLDGVPGLYWHSLQGLWARLLVDAKIHEAMLLSKGKGISQVSALLECNPEIEPYIFPNSV